MTVAELVFYALALIVIVAAIGVVTVPNVVHAALFLVISLLGVAGFYILLSSEFLALVQVLVYAGGISILMLFGLMLTRGREQNLPTVGPGGQWPLGLLAATGVAVVLLTAVLDTTWPRYVGEVTMISIDTFAGALFRDWLLPFELVGVLLLVALIGAVVIAHQEEEEA